MGGPKKLSAVAEARLERLREKHTEKMVAKANLKAEIEAAYRSKLRDLDFDESRLMNECLLAGVPKSRIGLAVGTQNWDRLNAMYALTEDEFHGEVEPVVSDWTLDFVEPFAGSYVRSDSVPHGLRLTKFYTWKGSVLLDFMQEAPGVFRLREIDNPVFFSEVVPSALVDVSSERRGQILSDFEAWFARS